MWAFGDDIPYISLETIFGYAGASIEQIQEKIVNQNLRLFKRFDCHVDDIRVY